MKFLALQQVDQKLDRLRSLSGELRPQEGWIRTLRKALHLTTSQLAKRLGITQSGIVRLEKREIEDTVTLGTLKKAAEALGGSFVYGIVFEKSLQSIKEEAIEKAAAVLLKDLVHTMALESQETTTTFTEQQKKHLMKELENSSRIWDF